MHNLIMQIPQQSHGHDWKRTQGRQSSLHRSRGGRSQSRTQARPNLGHVSDLRRRVRSVIDLLHKARRDDEPNHLLRLQNPGGLAPVLRQHHNPRLRPDLRPRPSPYRRKVHRNTIRHHDASEDRDRNLHLRVRDGGLGSGRGPAARERQADERVVAGSAVRHDRSR